MPFLGCGSQANLNPSLNSVSQRWVGVLILSRWFSFHWDLFFEVNGLQTSVFLPLVVKTNLQGTLWLIPAHSALQERPYFASIFHLNTYPCTKRVRSRQGQNISPMDTVKSSELTGLQPTLPLIKVVCRIFQLTLTSLPTHTLSPLPAPGRGCMGSKLSPGQKEVRLMGLWEKNVMISLLWAFSGCCNGLGSQIVVILFSEAAKLQVIAFGKSQIADGFFSDQIYFNSQ